MMLGIPRIYCVHNKRSYCLLLNMSEMDKRHIRIEFTQMFFAIHGDVNSSSRVSVLQWYYLHRLIKCQLGLSCWFQIRPVNTILLNWPI
jgi:hypothetical protein